MTNRVVLATYGRGIATLDPSPLPLYGLDIETDTTENGLDPAVAPVVSVAVVGQDQHIVLEGDESSLLLRLDATIASLPRGVLVTWNGAAFDLPFVAHRAYLCGIESGLQLWHDTNIRSRNEPLLGHPGSYRATWHGHRHLDGYRVFRADAGAVMHLPCGLKPMAKFVGLDPVEVDREQIHLLTDAERQAYVASDAEVTRELVIRRWATAKASIDDVSSLGPNQPFVPVCPPVSGSTETAAPTGAAPELVTQPQTIG